jgi:hypothetical protein
MTAWDEDAAVVEVWRTWGEAEANIVKGLLESNGIPCAIQGESTRITHGFTLDGLAEVRILVREADRERALEAISQTGDMIVCPDCRRPAQANDRACRFCRASLVDV